MLRFSSSHGLWPLGRIAITASEQSAADAAASSALPRLAQKSNIRFGTHARASEPFQ
jgi:hypothetical protein